MEIYTAHSIVVEYEVGMGMHAGRCAKLLSEVFEPKRFPWVELSTVPVGKIVKVVQLCPLGVPQYRVRSGSTQYAV